jgi:hypothetical protein
MTGNSGAGIEASLEGDCAGNTTNTKQISIDINNAVLTMNPQ